MKRPASKKLKRYLGAAGAVLTAAILTIVAPHAWAATLTFRSPTPPNVITGDFPNPGPGFKPTAIYKVVEGVQIYPCTASTDNPATGTWSTTSTPEAQLENRVNPRQTIHHFAGPRWQSNVDQSTVVAAVKDPAKDRKPKDGTIPWLLLTVTAHENAAAPGERPKLMDKVTHITRFNTTKGVGPTGACTPGTDKDQRVEYTADYVMWESTGGTVPQPAPSQSGGIRNPDPTNPGGPIIPDPTNPGGPIIPDPTKPGGPIIPDPTNPGGPIIPDPNNPGGPIIRDPGQEGNPPVISTPPQIRVPEQGDQSGGRSDDRGITTTR